jgi:hypothetical protein
MLRLKYLTAPCVAVASLALLTFTAAPATAVTAGFTMTFDEHGNCSSTAGTCTGVFEADPTATVSGNVWVFSLPSATFTGNVNILDPNGVTISDRLRWIDPNNSFSSCDSTSGLAACATHMIFYSLDDVAHTFGATTNSVTENADGTFQFVTANGVNTYDGVSQVPLPAALPLFATGLGALGLLGWRRKRKAVVAG